MTDWITLKLPSAAHVVGIARSMAVAAASTSALTPDQIDDVRTCASEAVTNAVQAHRRVEITLPVVIRAASEDDCFVLEVSDSGPGLEVNGTIDMAGALREGGYGIPVMQALSDSFQVSSGGVLNPAVGTTVRMTYRYQ
jgi:anti-sigma regulatory factor (Ser/Thr protein kinase)